MSIIHDEQGKRFNLTLDGHTAFLTYQVLDDERWLFDHTIVPSPLGGQGIGSRLVKYALDTAKDKHKKVIPACSFVAHFVKKHPEYQAIIHPLSPWN